MLLVCKLYAKFLSPLTKGGGEQNGTSILLLFEFLLIPLRTSIFFLRGTLWTQRPYCLAPTSPSRLISLQTCTSLCILVTPVISLSPESNTFSVYPTPLDTWSSFLASLCCCHIPGFC